MTNIPCPHCGRQISDQSRRCLYCAKPLSGEGVTEADKRARMLSAMYSAGVGLEPKKKRSFIERMASEPLATRVLVAIPVILFGLVWPPSAWRAIKTLFRP
jgi:hypothetical protein